MAESRKLIIPLVLLYPNMTITIVGWTFTATGWGTIVVSLLTATLNANPHYTHTILPYIKINKSRDTVYDFRQKTMLLPKATIVLLAETAFFITHVQKNPLIFFNPLVKSIFVFVKQEHY